MKFTTPIFILLSLIFSNIPNVYSCPFDKTIINSPCAPNSICNTKGVMSLECKQEISDFCVENSCSDNLVSYSRNFIRNLEEGPSGGDEDDEDDDDDVYDIGNSCSKVIPAMMIIPFLPVVRR